MRVRVLYFGMLKDLAGREEESLQVSDGTTLGDLYRDLQQRIPRLKSFDRAVALAINHEYSDSTAALQEDDEIALIPPVSGGGPKTSSARHQSPREEVAEPHGPLISAHARLVREPIDTTAIVRGMKRPSDGAVATFDGIVRNHSRGRRTLYLDYSAYDAMALRQMEELAQQAETRYEVRAVNIAHRLGRLQVGETSVFIAVVSAHRAAAFDACRWLIDTLKKTVPIWKKEYFEDGAVWADGEPFPPEISVGGGSASK